MAEQPTIDLATTCAVDFWTFAVPVLVGMLGSHAAGLAAKQMFNGDHAQTQEAALLATKFGAFWLLGGFTWIFLSKRKGRSA